MYFLRQQILPIGNESLGILNGREIKVVSGSMDFVIKFFRVGQHYVVLHVGVMTYAHEVIVPRPLSRNHEIAQEPVTQQHLDFLVVRGQISFGVVATVSVLATPVVTAAEKYKVKISQDLFLTKIKV